SKPQRQPPTPHASPHPHLRHHPHRRHHRRRRGHFHRPHLPVHLQSVHTLPHHRPQPPLTLPDRPVTPGELLPRHVIQPRHRVQRPAHRRHRLARHHRRRPVPPRARPAQMLHRE